MTRTLSLAVALAVGQITISAQELKPVPKGSERVQIPGCTKGYILTAGPRTEAQPGSIDIPVGMHLRMSGPRAMLKELQGREGNVVIVVGLVKSGQRRPDGLSLGGAVRIGGGPRDGGAPVQNQVYIDVEGWRPGTGECAK